MKKKIYIQKIIYHIIMCGVGFLMIYPLLWMVASSFKQENEIMVNAASLIPNNFTLDNYITGWQGVGKYTFADYFRNSIVLSFSQTFASVLSCTIVAYAFARIPFKGRKKWFALMIGSMCLPGMVMQIPQYLVFNRLGWVGTFLPLIIPAFTGSGYYIFMIMQFMKGIPGEIDEAARIDGCGWWLMLVHIMLPLVKPAVVMTAVLTFIGAWGDFYGALIYLDKPSMYPVAFALKLFSDEVSTQYGSLLAMSTLSLVPIMILFLLFQRQLIEGIASTGIKG